MFFIILCQSVYDKRRVLKPILVSEIEIIPWCLIFSNLSTPVHLYYRSQIKSIHVFKTIILVKLVFIVKMKMQDKKTVVKSRSAVVIFTAFESNHTASTGLSSF